MNWAMILIKVSQEYRSIAQVASTSHSAQPNLFHSVAGGLTADHVVQGHNHIGADLVLHLDATMGQTVRSGDFILKETRPTHRTSSQE
jgi:hypothetical protein